MSNEWLEVKRVSAGTATYLALAVLLEVASGSAAETVKFPARYDGVDYDVVVRRSTKPEFPGKKQNQAEAAKKQEQGDDD